jgi:cation diffusion facilitator family transporter
MRRSAIVLVITATVMVVEILGGYAFNSMALLADGWHMGTHTLAIGITVFAYYCAKKHATDQAFALGSWKVEILGGYTSAILLLVIAVAMAIESIDRLLHPKNIEYEYAIAIAFIGLIVNAICALLLSHKDGHTHHNHHHNHHHHHVGNSHSAHHHDLNLRAAYIHVLTDALTSILAIIALLCGLWLGWQWMDAAMGIVGAILVSLWSRSLIRDTGKVLLDREMDGVQIKQKREVIESVLDSFGASHRNIRIWRIGGHEYAAMIEASISDSDTCKKDLDQLLAEMKIEVRGLSLKKI